MNEKNNDLNQIVTKLLLSANFWAFFLLLILIRFTFWQYLSGDVVYALTPWFNHLQKYGFRGFQHFFSHYPAGYLYLLWLGSQFDGVPPVLIIKTISIIFDALMASTIFFIIKREYPEKTLKAGLGALIFLIMPIPFLNSGYWGQCDIIHTFFVALACVLFSKDKDFWGVIVFSIAAVFKYQAIFFMPVILIIIWKKHRPLYYLLFPPVIIMVSYLPYFIVGFTLEDWFTLIEVQKGPPILNLNTANAYVLFNFFHANDKLILKLSFIVALIALQFSILIIQGKKITKTYQYFLLGASITGMVVFLLPGMHDRYFFMTEVFLLILTFLKSEYWWVTLLFQLSALTVYQNYLHLNIFPIGIKTGALINLILIVYLLWDCLREFGVLPLRTPKNHHISR